MLRFAPRLLAVVAIAVALVLAPMAARADSPPASGPRQSPTPSITPQEETVASTPFLDCVVINRSPGAAPTYTAYLGYVNGSNTTPQYIPIGGANTFSGAPGGDAGQPTTFYPGEHHRVFSFTAPVGEVETWHLQGHYGAPSIVVVSADGPPCDGSTPGLPSTGLAPHQGA